MALACHRGQRRAALRDPLSLAPICLYSDLTVPKNVPDHDPCGRLPDSDDCTSHSAPHPRLCPPQTTPHPAQINLPEALILLRLSSSSTVSGSPLPGK